MYVLLTPKFFWDYDIRHVASVHPKERMSISKLSVSLSSDKLKVSLQKVFQSYSAECY